MGARGAFISASTGNFEFREGGQRYYSLGTLKSNSNVKILIMDSNRVKAPEYSPTPGRIYAVVKDGALKHLVYYDKNGFQAECVDFAHEHDGVKPHVHFKLQHNKKDPGVPPTAEQLKLAAEVRKEFKLI